jgi:hypothetical protein
MMAQRLGGMVPLDLASRKFSEAGDLPGETARLEGALSRWRIK